VRDPRHDYVASIGGNTHNYQRYPVRVEDGRVIQYIVSGGGGAYMTGTHKIPRVEFPGVDEEGFRCYPLRGDSLSVFSRNLDHRIMRGLFHLTIPPAEAAALMSERLSIAPTRRQDGQAVVTKRSRRAFRVIFPRRVRITGPLHENYAEWLDWNDPPIFKSFLRLDASKDQVRVRCFAATGCREHEDQPLVEDAITASRADDGLWRWSESTS
jgi:hypothetical protein